MRAISLVQRIEFEFTGNVVRNALTLGDVDNDGCNELIVGNQNGEIAIFKGRNRIQSISKLSFVACVAVGDILNQNKNCLVVITADGWCYIYEAPSIDDNNDNHEAHGGVEEVDGQIHSSTTLDTPTSDSTINSKTSSTEEIEHKNDLICIHMQRIPANAKNILLGDVDGDGMIEMVLGLTDRVVRSYRWSTNPHKPHTINANDTSLPFDPADKLLGKLVALNKWECANQIGSITLHHSWDGKPSLLIAQPGGTFMRIKCQCDDSVSQGLEDSEHSTSSSSQSESIPGSVDYQFLGLSRMRNPNISTEILGDFRSNIYESYDKASVKSKVTQKGDDSKSGPKGKPYAVATLDGTIMLVQDEVILWAIAVDHQVFALTKLDVTGNGVDDIVVCSWDGQTYILDQEKNTVRFHLDEPVQAFDSGYYNLDPEEPAQSCLVYVTFKNKIIIYYDIPLKSLNCKRFNPDLGTLSKLFVDDGRTEGEALDLVTKMDKKTKSELVEYLLYNVNS